VTVAGGPPALHPDSPKWHRRPEARPREILDAALEVLAEAGFAGTTIAEVARRAGVSPGLVVHYYGTKADLFAAVIEDSFLAFVAGEEALVARHEGSSRDLLQQLVRRFWEHCWTPRTMELLMVVKGQRAEFPEATHAVFRQLGGRWNGLIESVLAEGARRGEFRLAGPHVARVITSAVTGLAESSRCFGRLEYQPSAPDDLWAALSSLLDHGVLAGSAAAARQGESQ
jgi:AcrR family transcriptional regulator